MPGNSSYRIHRASIIFCVVAYVVVPVVIGASLRRIRRVGI